MIQSKVKCPKALYVTSTVTHFSDQNKDKDKNEVDNAKPPFAINESLFIIHQNSKNHSLRMQIVLYRSSKEHQYLREYQAQIK